MQRFTFSSNLSKYADPQGGGRLWHECLDTRHASWWAGTWFTGWSTVILTSQDVRIMNSCCFSIHFLLHPLLVTLTNYTSRHPQIIQALSYRRSVHIQTFTIRKTKRGFNEPSTHFVAPSESSAATTTSVASTVSPAETTTTTTSEAAAPVATITTSASTICERNNHGQ